VKTIIHDGEPTYSPGYRHCSLDAEVSGETIRFHLSKEAAARLRRALNWIHDQAWNSPGPLDLDPGEKSPFAEVLSAEIRGPRRPRRKK